MKIPPIGSSLLLVVITLSFSAAYNLRDLYKRTYHEKRSEVNSCPPWKPFRCPDEGQCIPLIYLCDSNPDCASGYDENRKMCIAATRPPVDESVDYLNALLKQHGADFLTTLFGDKGKNNMDKLGGVRPVAVALSESKNVEEFGETMGLSGEETQRLRQVMIAISNGDASNEGIKGSALKGLKFYVDKLVDTKFLS